MLIKIWANHSTEDVVSEKEFDEIRVEKTKSYVDDEVMFVEWLEDNYTVADAFSLTTEMKDDAIEHYKQYCVERADLDLEDEDGWRAYEVEI